jgi:tRNA pseudouridine13 synthase
MEELPRAVFRSSPEDFVVEEIPAYTASGKGEHLFITFRKTGLTTESAVRALAHALEVDPHRAGYAGMKDRHAVTTQTASFQVPIARDFAPSLAAAKIPGVEIIAAERHENKLKPGHLVGNRFRIVLRGLSDEDGAVVKARLDEVRRTGVPNAFGPQRFGRDGDNPARFLAWLRSGGGGRGRSGPRDKREQRLLFSALQSLLFNRVLERRERDGTWSAVLPGDLAKKHDTGGLFLVPAEGPEREDAEARAIAGGISATGPMFGVKMRWPEGTPLEIEREILRGALDSAGSMEALSPEVRSPAEADPSAIDLHLFEKVKHLGEGTRRALRLMVSDLTVEPVDPAGSCSQGLAVCFMLPKGGYATTVLARACRLVESGGERRAADPGADAALTSTEGDEGADRQPEE